MALLKNVTSVGVDNDPSKNGYCMNNNNLEKPDPTSIAINKDGEDKIDLFDPMLNQSTNYFIKFFKLNKLISPPPKRTERQDEREHHFPESLFEDFAFELFLLTQFNVHYLSWIKNRACHQHYMDRLPIFCKKISRLIQVQQCKPNRTDGDSDHSQQRHQSSEHGSNRTRFETWNKYKPLLIAKSIQEAFKYRRVVTIKFEDIRGLEHFSNQKKVKILITDDNNGGASAAGDGDSGNDKCAKEEPENKRENGEQIRMKQEGEKQCGKEGKDQVEEEEEENTDFNWKDWHDVNKALEDSDCEDYCEEHEKQCNLEGKGQQKKSENPNGWLNKFKSLVQNRCCANNDEDTENNSEGKQSEHSLPSRGADDILLAEFEMNNQDTICLVPFPDNSQFSDKEYFIQIKVVDVDWDEHCHRSVNRSKSGKSSSNDNQKPDPDNQIVISFSECTVGGFSGLSKNFSYQLNSDDRDMIFKFRIELKWQINEDTYFEENTMLEPFLGQICSKLGATLILIDSFYFWHFYKSFYLAMIRHHDDSVRIVAIEIFKEIAIGFNSVSIQKELVPIFVQMYSLPYPSKEEVELSEHYPKYKPEHLSLLENLIFIFHYLNAHDQMTYIKSLAPHCMNLVEYNAIWFKRILHLVRQNMGSYELDDIERTILPMAGSLMHCLDSVTESIDDPDSLPNWWWPTINGLASLAVGLAVESIDCLKPINWINCKITDPAMAPIYRSLRLLINLLLKPVGYRFLETFYLRLHNNQILHREHLVPFLNKKQLKKFYRFINNRLDEDENIDWDKNNIDVEPDFVPDSDNDSL